MTWLSLPIVVVVVVDVVKAILLSVVSVHGFMGHHHHQQQQQQQRHSHASSCHRIRPKPMGKSSIWAHNVTTDSNESIDIEPFTGNVRTRSTVITTPMLTNCLVFGLFTCTFSTMPLSATATATPLPDAIRTKDNPRDWDIVLYQNSNNNERSTSPSTGMFAPPDWRTRRAQQQLRQLQNLQDERLAMCVDRGAVWETCFMYGIRDGKDAVTPPASSSSSVEENTQSPPPPVPQQRQRPPTW